MYWMVVYSDLTGKLITIFDLMVAEDSPLFGEDDLPAMYLRSITMVGTISRGSNLQIGP